MSPLWLLPGLLMGPPGETDRGVESTKAEGRAKHQIVVRVPADKPAFRKAYLSVLQKSAKRKRSKPRRVVPELVALYGSVDNVKGVSHAGRRRMKTSLEGRLKQMKDRLISEKRRQRRSRRARPVRTEDPLTGKPLGGGGAEAASAQALIDLIQNTIEPESWDVNGGRGSASYFSLLKVLVIRQTGEVHHQIGGTLEVLR